MAKEVMMYRTAILAQNKSTTETNSETLNKLKGVMISFNNGDHIVDNQNNENSYSILKD